MKTKKKLLLLVLHIFCFGVFGQQTNKQNEFFKARVSTTDNHSIFTLFYESEYHTKAMVELVDNTNKVHFRKIYTAKDFIQPFDLQLLPKDIYTLQVTGMQSKFTHKIDLTGRESRAINFAFEPNNDTKTVNLISSEKQDNILKVIIVDKGGELLYSDEITPLQSLSKSYNFSKLKGDSYTFYIYNDGNLIKEHHVKF